MKWQSGELGSGFISDFKPLYLVMSSTPKIPGEMSAGARRWTSECSWHPGMLGPLVSWRVSVLKGEGASI